MNSLFEEEFAEFMEPLIVGTMAGSKSSEGHIENNWETKYKVDGVIQNLFTGRREEVSNDTHTEADYLILLPLQTSSGEEIVIEPGYEVQKGSSFSSEVPSYEIFDHDVVFDYVLEMEALRYERG